jgi:hypothetical protein
MKDRRLDGDRELERIALPEEEPGARRMESRGAAVKPDDSRSAEVELHERRSRTGPQA